jgi:release factor glutamine methyltransferase
LKHDHCRKFSVIHWTLLDFEKFRCIILSGWIASMLNLINETASRIKDQSDNPNLVAQVLLAYITGSSRAWVLAHPDITLSSDQKLSYEDAISRLKQGVPLPYILGTWEFLGLSLIVSPDVLIPRPETELLVEMALDWLHANPGQRSAMDTGTGSGCIAVSLAVKVPDLQLIACDISAPALQVARQNAQKFNVSDRIKLILCDLFPEKTDLDPGRFDLMLANLPYIPTAVLHELQVFGREPDLALDGGEDGLDLIRQYLDRVPAYLNPGGLILMEIEASQGFAALALASDRFDEAEIQLHQDLAGKDRILEIKLGS